tara:strand:- start:851 stop:1822 length:972 start_codon:yes stop_codon:yes gene_type:complete
MSAWKQFLSQDIIVEPFELNKSFTFPASQFTDSNVDIDRYLGINGNFEFTQSLTGNNNDQYGVLIYNSAKELYYSNFLSSSYGSPLQTQSLLPGDDTAGDVFRGSPDSSGRYDNYLQTTTNGVRFFPTGSSDKIVTLSIPSRLWGDYVQPGSFVYTCVSESISYTITDDSQGNLYTNGAYCGNIIYPHGLAVFTSLMDNKPPSPEGYGISEYGEDMYGGGITVGALLSTNATCSFSSSFTIYETQYKATVSPSEFNFSQNPSALSGSNGYIYDYLTGSYFDPYVTTVGLYDEAQNLLAVGKLSQPLPTSRTTDTAIFINIDRT